MKRRVVVMVAAVSMLAGCGMFGGGKPKEPTEPKETSVEMTLTAGNQLNPNAQRRPSPVVVRVFDLKTRSGFDAANFDSLFERDRETLAAELVGRDEFVLNPGDAKKIERKLAPETKVLGVAVAFRELERASWRTTVAVKPNAKNRVVVSVDGVTVIATVVP
jgi:type VI secretion system protein VasD